MLATLGMRDCCDSCGVQALVRATQGDRVLQFCGHHGNQYRATLQASGWTLADERGCVIAGPRTSPSERSSLGGHRIAARCPVPGVSASAMLEGRLVDPPATATKPSYDTLSPARSVIGQQAPGSRSSAPDAAPTPAPLRGSGTTPVPHGTRTGPDGRTRNPLGGWLLLLPTLGLYYLFWYYRVNRELQAFDPSIKVRPVLAVLTQLIPIAGLVSVYNTGKRIQQAQTTARVTDQASAGLGVAAALCCFMVLPYYSGELNTIWMRRP